VPLLEQVLETYPAKVKIAFKNFPLRNHKNAMKAATAALAAGSQGKFWEFHDLLFKNYKSLNDKKINDIAVVLQLDQTEFEQKMKTPEIANQIRQDTVDGQRAGVRGTPVVFINGKMLRDRSLNGFKAIIDEELKKSQSQ
jgi:protein-disulfide isomerase